mmetsp:Transcript_1489/g.3193  ORF Transcript_1489/g.3193 Transcript_1489/m.3193 type:complete len:237 (+) Transcript_1489:280-990(+)
MRLKKHLLSRTPSALYRTRTLAFASVHARLATVSCFPPPRLLEDSGMECLVASSLLPPPLLPTFHLTGAARVLLRKVAELVLQIDLGASLELGALENLRPHLPMLLHTQPQCLLFGLGPAHALPRQASRGGGAIARALTLHATGLLDLLGVADHLLHLGVEVLHPLLRRQSVLTLSEPTQCLDLASPRAARPHALHVCLCRCILLHLHLRLRCLARPSCLAPHVSAVLVKLSEYRR